MKTNISLLLIITCLLSFARAQNPISGTLNFETPVSAVNPTTNSVTVGSPLGFSIGDRVILIQMQGASVDHSNTASYGSLSAVGSAGNYEWNEICDIIGNEVYLRDSLAHVFTAGDGVQLVYVPVFTSATVTGSLTANTWNGNSGGLLALEVSDTLFMAADIDMSGRGFRGGNPSVDFHNAALCTRTDFFYAFALGYSGFKGEGIAAPTLNEETGRGASANGAGGGNHTNAGGGGGGNGVSGGDSGQEWGGCSTVQIGGVGGYGLPYSNALNKVFLGGGGGGGHQNNTQSSAGGNGGGIVMIRAGHIQSSGQTIRSNGAASALAGIDGAGGGGAAGSILLEVGSFGGTLLLQAQGGNGGGCTTNHGPGGGGAGGVIWHSGVGLPVGVSTNVAGGLAGVDGSSNSRLSADGNNGSVLGSLSLANGGGIVPVCPIVLSQGLDLDVEVREQGNLLSWTPLQQTVRIQRSNNSLGFVEIGTKGAGAEAYWDVESLAGMLYYRLEFSGSNGQKRFSEVVAVKRDSESWRCRLQSPIQVGTEVRLWLEGNFPEDIGLSLWTVKGKRLWTNRRLVSPSGEVLLEAPEQAGIYLLRVQNRSQLFTLKLMVRP